MNCIAHGEGFERVLTFDNMKVISEDDSDWIITDTSLTFCSWECFFAFLNTAQGLSGLPFEVNQGEPIPYEKGLSLYCSQSQHSRCGDASCDCECHR